MAPPLSIIIPTLNEARNLPSLLRALAPARARGAEVLVVDHIMQVVEEQEKFSMDRTLDLEPLLQLQIWANPYLLVVVKNTE